LIVAQDKNMTDIIDINIKRKKVLEFDEWKGYEGVPEHTRGALLRYRDRGFPPGSFLTSVLTNNLFGAVAQADKENSRALKDICGWVHWRMPSASWGSDEKMEQWISAGGIAGLNSEINDE
jgi:hypothetical protein